METTYVSVSSDTIRDYAFIIPLTCLFWRDVVGFKPLPFLVGPFSEKKNEVVLKAFEYHSLNINRVDKADEHHISSTIAQNVRQHAPALLTDNEAWLMPGDADLWPLKRDFYCRHLGSNAKAISYYSNGDHFAGKEAVVSAADRGADFQTLPTCHVAMKVKTWHELYKYQSTNVLECALATLEVWLKPKLIGKNPSQAAWESWMSDQRIMTERVCRADWFPNEAILVSRDGHPPSDRLDRGHMHDWNNMNPGRWTDAHLLRAPEENWSLIRPLIAHYIPQHLAWADDYHQQYMAAR